MADIIVKIFRGEVEVASKLIPSPVTALEAYSVLQNANAGWVGTLIQPTSNDLLVGQRELTPGRVYHLHLQAGKYCNKAPAHVFMCKNCTTSIYRYFFFLIICDFFGQLRVPQQRWDPAASARIASLNCTPLFSGIGML